MSFEYDNNNVNVLTKAQDLETWNRKRTGEELRGFVAGLIGRKAIERASRVETTLDYELAA